MRHQREARMNIYIESGARNNIEILVDSSEVVGRIRDRHQGRLIY